jgi:hypothetical protein
MKFKNLEVTNYKDPKNLFNKVEFPNTSMILENIYLELIDKNVGFNFKIDI